MAIQPPSQTEQDRILAAERAVLLLGDARHELSELDGRFIAMVAHFIENRQTVIREMVTPAKKILGDPAYVKGQHENVINASVRSGNEHGIPEHVIRPFFEFVLALSVETQREMLGGPGIPETPTVADLHRVE
ncbi:hypothetical protein KC960_04160 [Candidatus Saccharibacteria bacterium]|nr:hypothetical protein [Candidatus Saccharibacteria bacterium]